MVSPLPIDVDYVKVGLESVSADSNALNLVLRSHIPLPLPVRSSHLEFRVRARLYIHWPWLCLICTIPPRKDGLPLPPSPEEGVQWTELPLSTTDITYCRGELTGLLSRLRLEHFSAAVQATHPTHRDPLLRALRARLTVARPFPWTPERPVIELHTRLDPWMESP